MYLISRTNRFEFNIPKLCSVLPGRPQEQMLLKWILVPGASFEAYDILARTLQRYVQAQGFKPL